MRPVVGNGQLHNYTLIFLISAIGFFISFVWSIFFINEQKDKEKFDQQFGDNNVTDTEIERQNYEKNSQILESKQSINTIRKGKTKSPIKLLFNLNNIKDMFKTCFKKRDNRVRLQIWLIILAMLSHHFIGYAPTVFQFQFVEKIYFWDAETYGYADSIGSVAHAVFSIICAPILIKVLYIFIKL